MRYALILLVVGCEHIDSVADTPALAGPEAPELDAIRSSSSIHDPPPPGAAPIAPDLASLPSAQKRWFLSLSRAERHAVRQVCRAQRKDPCLGLVVRRRAEDDNGDILASVDRDVLDFCFHANGRRNGCDTPLVLAFNAQPVVFESAVASRGVMAMPRARAPSSMRICAASCRPAGGHAQPSARRFTWVGFLRTHSSAPTLFGLQRAPHRACIRESKLERDHVLGNASVLELDASSLTNMREDVAERGPRVTEVALQRSHRRSHRDGYGGRAELAMRKAGLDHAHAMRDDVTRSDARELRARLNVEELKQDRVGRARDAREFLRRDCKPAIRCSELHAASHAGRDLVAMLASRVREPGAFHAELPPEHARECSRDVCDGVLVQVRTQRFALRWHSIVQLAIATGVALKAKLADRIDERRELAEHAQSGFDIAGATDEELGHAIRARRYSPGKVDTEQGCLQQTCCHVDEPNHAREWRGHLAT
jgi:hypothetical protein